MHLCDFRPCPLHGCFGGKADLSRRRHPVAHGPPSRSTWLGSDKTRPGTTTQSSRAEGACPGAGRAPWLRRGGARCGPACGPAPTPYSHTPPRAAARRYAALQMTLVHAHRGARRDSPVLPVRIFPVGLSRPNLGERPSSADATQTPSPCQDGPLGYVRLTNSPCHANAR